MDKQETRELRTRYGRGRMYQDLVACDLTYTDYRALVAQYKTHDLDGPHWNSWKRQWFIQGFRNIENGVNWTCHWSGCIDPFLEVEKEVESFTEVQERACTSH